MSNGHNVAMIANMNKNMEKGKLLAAVAAIAVLFAAFVAFMPTADAADVPEDATEITADTDWSTLSAGNYVINGSVNVNDATIASGVNVYVASGAALTVAAGGLTIEGGIYNNGYLYLYGALNDAEGAVFQNDGTVYVYTDAALDCVTLFSGTGNIDVSAVSDNASLGGTLKSSTSFDASQTVTIVDNLTIAENQSLTIYGTLVIPEGMSIDISAGASLIVTGQAAVMENNGTITVEHTGGLTIGAGADANNAGTIVAAMPVDYDAVAQNGILVAGNLVSDGTVEIQDRNGILVTGSYTNNGNLNVAGQIQGAVSNAGTVAMAGTVVAGATISMVSTDAQVTVTSVSGAALTINDNGMQTGVRNADFVNTEDNSVVVIPNSYSVAGLTVTESIQTTGTGSQIQYTKQMDVAGALTATLNAESSEGAIAANVAIDGDTVAISTDVTVGENITFVNNGALAVSGTLTFATTMSNNGTIVVTGEIITTGTGITAETGISAARYTVAQDPVAGTPAFIHYTTIENAISAGATMITVLGSVEITSDVTVPNGTTVAQSQGSQITVVEDATLTVANGGVMRSEGMTIVVEGTLYAENARTGIGSYNVSDYSLIVSEVYSLGDADAQFTSLANAIADASAGATIKLHGATVIDSPLTIPADVTVDTNGQNLDVKETTLTVNGTLYLNGGTYTVTDGQTASGMTIDAQVVLNGYIRSGAELTYNGNEYPAGAYYTTTDRGIVTYWITTFANAAAAESIDGNTFSVYGEVDAGTASVTGTAAEPKTVNVYGALTVAELTIDNATVVIADAAATIEGTVTNGTGSIDFTDAAFGAGANIAAETVDGQSVLVLAGTISGTDSKVEASGEVVAGAIIIENLSVAGTMTVDDAFSVTNLAVSGTLNVPSGESISATVATVTGTLAVAEQTASDAPGSARITTLYVGLTADDVENGVAGTAGTVTGPYVVTGLEYVSSSAEVPEKDVAGVQFVISEGNVWMTVYGSGVIPMIYNAPVENADFVHWDDENGNEVTELRVVNGGAYYAHVDYNIYGVTVIADNGIGTVAINGVVLPKYSNQFVAEDLAAGTYTISFTAKNGYSVEDVTVQVNGQTVSGNTFTLSGTSDSDRNVTIVLNGSTVATQDPVVIEQGSADDSMGITDYLLIILVILVIVMAIMVAMRLMRS